jgi:hypothetical protein
MDVELERKCHSASIKFTLMTSPVYKTSDSTVLSLTTNYPTTSIPLTVLEVKPIFQMLESPMDQIFRSGDIRIHIDTKMGGRRLVICRMTSEPCLQSIIFDEDDLDEARKLFGLMSEIMLLREFNHQAHLIRKAAEVMVTGYFAKEELDKALSDDVDWDYRCYHVHDYREGKKVTPMTLEVVDAMMENEQLVNRTYLNIILVLGCGVSPPESLDRLDVESLTYKCLHRSGAASEESILSKRLAEYLVSYFLTKERTQNEQNIEIDVLADALSNFTF